MSVKQGTELKKLLLNIYIRKEEISNPSSHLKNLENEEQNKT